MWSYVNKYLWEGKQKREEGSEGEREEGHGGEGG